MTRLLRPPLLRLPLLLLLPWLMLGACTDRMIAPPVGGMRPPPGGPGAGPCRSNTICDPSAPDVVRSCEPDGTTRVLLICDQGLACSHGRCVSPHCLAAESQPSTAGCLFYATDLDNVDSDDTQPTLIVVTNPGDLSATVDLEIRQHGAWASAQSKDVSGGHAVSFTLANQHVEGSGLGPALARRIVSDMPVTAMMVQSSDPDQTATSSSGTMLLPVHSLGTSYMAMTYKQVPTDEILELPGGRDGAAELAVVATQDLTTLRIWRQLVPLSADPQVVVIQNDGDVYQMVSESDFDDFSGMTVLSDKPVALFSGNVTTTYGRAATGINSPDMAMEQMLPLGAWNKTYVAARLPAADQVCDSVLGGGSVGSWQILASEQTTLYFTSEDPDAALPGPVPIGRGEIYPLFFDSKKNIDFVVSADEPILVTQGMDCEATLSTAIPADAPMVDQVFALPANFDHALAIARRDDGRGTPVIFDNQDITAQFIDAGLGFSTAQVFIPPCYGTVDQCLHHLAGAYGLTLRGMDVICSYAVTYPTWVQCIDAGCGLY